MNIIHFIVKYILSVLILTKYGQPQRATAPYTVVPTINSYLIPIVKLTSIDTSQTDLSTNSEKKLSSANGIYRIEFHAVLNALYDVLIHWGCRSSVVILNEKTGYTKAIVTHFFSLRGQHCQSQAMLIDDIINSNNYCDILQSFRNLIYISPQNMNSFFTAASNCDQLFSSMHTWIIISTVSQIQTFHSKKLLTFVQSPMSQITFFVPIEQLEREKLMSYVSHGMASRVEMYDVFYSDSSLQVEAILFAYWTHKGRLHYLEQIDDEKKLRGRRIRVVTTPSGCPLVCAKRPNSTELQRGYITDMFEATEKAFRANHVITISSEMGWGTRSPNGSFNGFLGELQRGESDLGLMATAITHERIQHAINYGAILINGYMQLTIKRPLPLIPPTIYVLPFDLPVWYFVFGFIILIHLLMVFIHKVNVATKIQDMEIEGIQRDINIRKRVDFDIFDQMANLRGLAAKIVTLTQLIAVFMVFTYYTSVLTSFFAYRDIKLPFNSLEELAARKDYKILVVKDTIYQLAFQNAKEGVYQRIWKGLMQSGKRGLIPDFFVGFTMAARDEKSAYFTNSYAFQSVVTQSCSLMFVPAKYLKESYPVPFRKDFPYQSIYSYSMLKLREGGIYTRLDKKYISLRPKDCEDTGGSETLEIMQTYSIFAFLLSSYAVVIITLLLENLWYYYQLQAK